MIFLRMLTFNLPICQLGWESFVASMAFELGSCEFRELGSDLPKASCTRLIKTFICRGKCGEKKNKRQ